jgi:hypothetical protein
MGPGDAIVGVVAFTAIGAIGLTIARAFAQRISGGAGASRREVDAMREEIEQLKGELDQVHGRLQDVDDIQNRLDFAERMLAQVREKAALPGPR